MRLKNKHLRGFSYAATAAIFVIGITLYNTNYRVRSIRTELAQVHQETSKLAESLHVLNAEWSYLDSPSRLKKLNKKILAMEPIHLTQLASWKQAVSKPKGPHIVLAYNGLKKGGAG